MENSNWIDYKIEIRNRLKTFALNIINLSEEFPNTIRGNILNKQIARSGMSVYANYRAALRGRSKAEFFAKLSIAVEEADETEMWLDLIIDSKLFSNNRLSKLHNESIELIKILSVMRKKLNGK